MSRYRMKWLDIPPVWLCFFLALTYGLQSLTLPWGALPQAIFGPLGAVLIVSGLGLMLLAVGELFRHKTTVIPHLQASNLVQSGIFKLSRNPIYLGDLLVLAGCALRWDAPLGLLFIPLFGWILTTRFIRPEEERLREKFGVDFLSYVQQTRRWL